MGEYQVFYAGDKSGNGRIVYRFDGSDAIDIDLIDNHRGRRINPVPKSNPPHPGADPQKSKAHASQEIPGGLAHLL
ncbi:MAG: hypothetical protein BMS9Abin05_0979 [Rhodothermia bacterium]|nr:MAG: hypothetical protein BMS9Abin05_0979 [Rhodothermia bacterium]